MWGGVIWKETDNPLLVWLKTEWGDATVRLDGVSKALKAAEHGSPSESMILPLLGR